MLADEGKMKAMVTEGAVEDYFDQTDEEFFLLVEKLQQVQEELSENNREELVKVLEVEVKGIEMSRPVYLKRNEIIQTIPDFWLTIFMGHPVLCDRLSTEDQKVFKYLSSLDVEDFKDIALLGPEGPRKHMYGFCVTFNFNENPYFHNPKLTKTFTYFNDHTTKITGTTIKWKEGMILKVFANVDHNNKGNKRPHAEESFFSWFEETEKRDVDGVQEEVLKIIAQELWSNPLDFFNKGANQKDSWGDDDDGMENGDNDEGEDDNTGDC